MTALNLVVMAEVAITLRRPPERAFREPVPAAPVLPASGWAR